MSASATEHKRKEHEGSSPTQTINEVFNESMRGYEKAVKSGIQLQEQSIQYWSQMLSKVGSSSPIQGGFGVINAEFIPAFHKQMDENLEAFNLMSSQSAELLQKTTGLLQSTSVPEAQRRLQDYMEALLGSARVNVHLALNTTARMISFWSESALQASRAVGRA